MNDKTKKLSTLAKRYISFMLAVLCVVTLNVSVAHAASIPTITSVTAKTADSIKIKWKKYSGATGYIVYQKKEDGKYKKVKTIKNAKTTSYTSTDLDSATKYSYKIKAYTVKKVKNKTKTTYTDASKAKSAYTKLDTTKITAIAGITANSIKIKWKLVDDADGYLVYKKTRDGYEKVVNVKSGTKSTYTIKKLPDGKKQGFAVRAYKKVGSKYIYGDLSAVKYSFPAMPVPLNELHCIEQGYECGYTDSSIQDSFGNYYNGYITFSGSPYKGTMVYNLNHEYTKLSFDIIGKHYIHSDLNATIDVYLDDILIYSLPAYTKTTGKVHVELDVENGEVLKIVAYDSTYSWGESVCLVNAQVSK